MTSSTQTPESGSYDQGMTPSTDYAKLFIDSQREAEPVPLAAYEQLAQQIGEGRKYSIKKKMSAGEIITELHEVYGEQADPRLSRFATVAIDAPKMAAFQGSIDRSRGAQVSHEDGVKLRERAYSLCTYNDKLRNMLLEGRTSFDRPGITQLLDRATNDQVTGFLHEELTGMIGEITLGDTLGKLPGVSDFTYTEPDIDFTNGIDMIMRYYGQTVAYDSKSGDLNIGKTDKVRFQNVLIPRITMNVPSNCVGDIGPTDWGRAQLGRRAETLMVAAGLNPRGR